MTASRLPLAERSVTLGTSMRRYTPSRLYVPLAIKIVVPEVAELTACSNPETSETLTMLPLGGGSGAQACGSIVGAANPIGWADPVNVMRHTPISINRQAVLIMVKLLVYC